jgi:uncharacterized protein (DUF2235 family)
MPKNILIFSDGTGQEGGLRPDQHLSNIYKLYRATRVCAENEIDPSTQIAYYDPGLGTNRDEGRLRFRFVQKIRKAISAGLGVGISRNIADCYEAILRHYEPGDRVFLFGFSRGAYTARCVAGVMNLCGVPTQEPSGGPLPRSGKALRATADEAVKKVYEHGAGRDRAKFEPEREEQARRFRAKYGADNNGVANVAPYFIGVFDTVAALGAKGIKRFIINALIVTVALLASALLAWGLSAVGLPFGLSFWSCLATVILLIGLMALNSSLRVITDYPSKGQFRWHLAGFHSGFYDRFLDPHVRYARHALAIDETREDFARVPWGVKGTQPPRDSGEPEWLIQLWFAGCHSDIGGSYAEDESRLSDISLTWILEEAMSLPNPILLDRSKLHPFPDPGGMQHSEVWAMRDSYPTWIPYKFAWKERPRVEALGAPWHPSVLQRFALPTVLYCGIQGPYRPSTLRSDSRVSKYYEAMGAETTT